MRKTLQRYPGSTGGITGNLHITTPWRTRIIPVFVGNRRALNTTKWLLPLNGQRNLHGGNRGGLTRRTCQGALPQMSTGGGSPRNRHGNPAKDAWKVISASLSVRAGDEAEQRSQTTGTDGLVHRRKEARDTKPLTHPSINEKCNTITGLMCAHLPIDKGDLWCDWRQQGPPDWVWKLDCNESADTKHLTTDIGNHHGGHTRERSCENISLMCLEPSDSALICANASTSAGSAAPAQNPDRRRITLPREGQTQRKSDHRQRNMISQRGGLMGDGTTITLPQGAETLHN
ncbi:hypothetical protein Bbelb_266630 [Branchiostoma belcheri]|nr:hypothetical protein Bbelb_266630 [Branchiostoma belcheri]